MKKTLIVIAIILISFLWITRNIPMTIASTPSYSQEQVTAVDVSETGSHVQCIAYEQLHEVTKDDQVMTKTVCYREEIH